MAHHLLEQKLLILDGGLGTTLEDEHGAKFGDATPLWSSHYLVENIDTLETVQRDFAQAGADIILTATYQASFYGFKNTKLASEQRISREDAKKHMLSAVTIAREAFGGRLGMVALSLGAYGATMIPGAEYSGQYGSMTEEDLFNFHLERLSVFTSSQVWSGVDIIAFETLPRIDEVRATRKVMQSIEDRPYWISCVFPNDDGKLPDGTSINELVVTMLEGKRAPYAIGMNCTKVRKLEGLIEAFENAAQAHGLKLPRLVIYPDGTAGKVYDTKIWQWVGEDISGPPWEEQMAEIVQRTQSRGRWQGIVVGGCCKTTPGHISRMKQRLRAT
jgi:homocysteine S-methyltransferase